MGGRRAGYVGQCEGCERTSMIHALGRCASCYNSARQNQASASTASGRCRSTRRVNANRAETRSTGDTVDGLLGKLGRPGRRKPTRHLGRLPASGRRVNNGSEVSGRVLDTIPTVDRSFVPEIVDSHHQTRPHRPQCTPMKSSSILVLTARRLPMDFVAYLHATRRQGAQSPLEQRGGSEKSATRKLAIESPSHAC